MATSPTPTGKPATSRQYGALTASQQMAMTDARNRTIAMPEPVSRLKRESAPAATQALNQAPAPTGPQAALAAHRHQVQGAGEDEEVENDHLNTVKRA